jgi:hypothetical protein
MVRANCANRNAKIHAPLSSDPRARRSTFNAPSPAAGGGMGCPLAPGPAEGARDGRRAGRLGRRCARLLRASPDGAAALRSCVARAPTDRARILANPDGARAPQTARQRSASPRTTRKDFWWGEMMSLMNHSPAAEWIIRNWTDRPYWASAFSAAIRAFMSSSVFEGRHASPRLANSIARPTPWAVCAASCATI